MQYIELIFEVAEKFFVKDALISEQAAIQYHPPSTYRIMQLIHILADVGGALVEDGGPVV